MHCRIIAFLLLIRYFALWPWPLTPWPWLMTFYLEHLQRIICDVHEKTLYEIWTQSSHQRRSYCDFSVWPYDLEHCITRCARLWDNFHQVWPPTTYPCLNYSVLWCWYVMSRCDLDLWPVDLDSLWYIKRHLIKVCTKCERNRAISGWIIDNFANFCTRYVTLWPSLLTSWSWTFSALWVSCL